MSKEKSGSGGKGRDPAFELRPVRDDFVFLFGVDEAQRAAAATAITACPPVAARRRARLARRRPARHRLPQSRARASPCRRCRQPMRWTDLLGRRAAAEERSRFARRRRRLRRAGRRGRIELPQQRAKLVARVQLAQRWPCPASRGRELRRIRTAARSPVRMVASLRDSSSVVRPARRFSPTLPLMSLTCSMSPSSVPYWFSHFAAVFGPTFSMPGMLSELSPTQREVIDDLFRINVELGLHAGAIEHRVAHRVDERDRLVHQLRHVLVAGRDEDLLALFRRAHGERADDVVRLDAGHAQQRPAQRLDDGEQRLDLRPQVIRHGRPVRLVFAEQLVAEGLAFGVEHDGHALRAVVLHELEQHVQHAEHGARGLAPGVREGGQGVEGPVQIRRAVDENEIGCAAHDLCRMPAVGAGV